MILTPEIKEICRQYDIRPLRQKGQNFLISPRIYDKVIEAADLKRGDIILEIGPGLGTLTRELAARVEKVIAVEIDKKLVEILKEQLKDYSNIEIIEGDILKITNSKLEIPQPRLARLVFDESKRANYKLVANLPYNITGAVLRKFLGQEPKPNLIVLMLQKEVGQRICAQSPKMSLLSVMVQFYGRPKIVAHVSKNNFWPRPRIDSVILKIADIQSPAADLDEKKFFEMARSGFSSPRKYLINNLIRGKIFDDLRGRNIFSRLSLNQKIRAQELSIDDWIKLYNMMLINPASTRSPRL